MIKNINVRNKVKAIFIAGTLFLLPYKSVEAEEIKNARIVQVNELQDSESTLEISDESLLSENFILTFSLASLGITLTSLAFTAYSLHVRNKKLTQAQENLKYCYDLGKKIEEKCKCIEKRRYE